MRGQIVIENSTGERMIFIPESRVIFYVASYQSIKEKDVRAYEVHPQKVLGLNQYYQFTSELEVPNHIARFALNKARHFHGAIDGIADVLQDAVRDKNSKGGFRDFLGQLEASRREEKNLGVDRESEERMIPEIEQLMAKARGLQ